MGAGLVCWVCARFHAAMDISRLTVGHPTSGRDFFSNHFDINYLPENQARTEALWETNENGGRAAYYGGRRVTVVARLCLLKGGVSFPEGSGSELQPYSLDASMARTFQTSLSGFFHY